MLYTHRLKYTSSTMNIYLNVFNFFNRLIGVFAFYFDRGQYSSDKKAKWVRERGRYRERSMRQDLNSGHRVICRRTGHKAKMHFWSYIKEQGLTKRMKISYKNIQNCFTAY